MTEPERKMIDVAALDCESIVTREENAERSEEAIARYCGAYLRGDPMPEIEVWEDEQGEYYVVDGRHRTRALRKAAEIDCEESGKSEAHPNLLRTACHIVGRGSFEDGYRYALERTNHRNGLELNGGDKRARIAKALVLNLYVEDGAQPSNRALAEKLGVSHTSVSEVRKSLESEGLIEASQKRRSKDGRTRTSESEQRGGGRSTGKSVSSRSGEDDSGGDPTVNGLTVDEDYPAGDAEASESRSGEADADSPTEPQTADAQGQPVEADAGGIPDGEAEPPPPSDGADERPEWLPRYGVELQAYADGLRSVNREHAAQRNGPGQWGQSASKAHAKVKEAITALEASVPVLCPACDGREGKGCPVCSRRGWLAAGEAEQVSTSKRKRRAS